ncbi:c-type cytochrome [Rhizobium sp. XQZ8]|uniref:cytochrome c n=1 Tax=Rhizobium populisoli TaxID=2859785 RepID=UPI001CA5C73D|nr:cytochrome c [Rhizobium populisoli]MBW6424629.1 c-type cytochrome [Rhizobium populisoli]
MRFLRVVSFLLTVVVVAAVGFLIIGWRSELPPDEKAATAQHPPDLVAKGAQLAAVGNCIACHTKPGQAAFAGGLPVPTPFGTLYSTNITPDPQTGIGSWSEAAFNRAMREGVDREGDHLYPAFPYDHFTWVTDEDNKALYAFLMTRTPVKATAPKNELIFPLQFRPLLVGWNMLFFREGVMQPDSSQSEAWNRGRYLAEGLGHCGACHTPRNSLGAEDRGNHFAGGEAEGWQAYAINAASRSPVPWTTDSIAFYLRNGWHELHGVSRGPMAEVTGNLGLLPDSDIQAIATYVASVMGEPSADRKAKGEKLAQSFGNGGAGLTTAAVNIGKPAADLASHPGAAIYTAACSTCHESGKAQPFGGLNFNLSTAVNAPNPQNIVNVTMFGLPPADGQPSAVMPAFGNTLNDQQVADLLGYLRARFSDQPVWSGLTDLVAKTRSGEHPVTVLASDGIERAPKNVGAKEQK